MLPPTFPACPARLPCCACPPQPIRGFDATFSSAGLLTISGCTAGAATGYTRFPDTRMWSVEQKTHLGAAYQVNVLKLLKVRPWCQAGRQAGRQRLQQHCAADALHVHVLALECTVPWQPQAAAPVCHLLRGCFAPLPPL